MPSVKQEGLCSLKLVRAEPRGVYRKSVLMRCWGKLSTRLSTLNQMEEKKKKKQKKNTPIYEIRDRKCLLVKQSPRLRPRLRSQVSFTCRYRADKTRDTLDFLNS